MKVIVYNDDNVVTQVFLDVHDPKYDADKGVITHSMGKILNLNKPDRNFMILEEDIPAKVGTIVTDSLKDYNQTHRFDGFTFDDVTKKIEEVGEDIKSEIKEMIEGNKDKDR